MTSEERREARYLRRREARRRARERTFARYDDFEKVFTYDHLWTAYRRCLRGVGWKGSTQRYRNRPMTNLAVTYRALHSGRYRSRGFYCFTIRERGKERFIRAVHISERVVQKCLCDFSLVPMLTPTLIHDCGASIKGKGIDFSKRRAVCHLERHIRKSGTEGYALSMDYSKYFDGILHERVEEMILRTYTDGRLIRLILHFVRMFGDVGLGLGSQVSQILAVAYPGPVDRVALSEAGVQYARYMDDSYAVHADKGTLWALLDRMRAACDGLGIVLNPRKTRVVKLTRGLPFLKERMIPCTGGRVLRLPDAKSFARYRRSLRRMGTAVIEGRLDARDAKESYRSRRAHLEGCHARRVLRETDQKFQSFMRKGENKWRSERNTPTSTSWERCTRTRSGTTATRAS